jgi:hypothetical protein
VKLQNRKFGRNLNYDNLNLNHYRPKVERVHRMKHLVVFVHGLQGSASHGKYLKERLEAMNLEEDNDSILQVMLSKCNSGILKSFFTTGDGIDVGGIRLLQEIEQFLRKSEYQYDSISLIGSSMGGLYCRYVTSCPEWKTLLEEFNLRPLLFITLATPHLSNRTILTGISAIAGMVMFGRSASQLMLEDADLLLHKLTFPEALSELNRFHSRIVYSSCMEDHLVPFTTGAFLPHLPTLESEDDNTDNGGIPVSVDSTVFNLNDITVDQCYFGKDSKADIMFEMLKNLNQDENQWERYMLRLSHAHIACPFPPNRIPLVDHIVEKVMSAID